MKENGEILVKSPERVINCHDHMTLPIAFQLGLGANVYCSCLFSSYRAISAIGLEATMGVCHFGHFLFTALAWPMLSAEAMGRESPRSLLEIHPPIYLSIYKYIYIYICALFIYSPQLYQHATC